MPAASCIAMSACGRLRTQRLSSSFRHNVPWARVAVSSRLIVPPQLMRHMFSMVVIACGLLALTGAYRPAAAAEPVPPVAFIDVSVISMHRDEVRRNQTVIVEEGRISAVGPTAAIHPPRGALRIAGRGRYLMPGLVDMHVHFLRREAGSDAPEFARLPGVLERIADFATLYVANGVTSVRQMHAYGDLDDPRLSRTDREWLGPTLYTTGPMTDGDPPDHPVARIVVTPADAARAVAEDRAAGRIGVKVYSALSAPVYDAIVAAAAREGIDVVGHVPHEVGLAHTIASGQATIEHIVDSFLPALSPRQSAGDQSDAELAARYRNADLKRLAEYAVALRRARIWTCPTVVVALADSTEYLKRHELRYVSPAFTAGVRKYNSAPATFEEQLQYALSAVKTLHEHGAGLLLGSDAWNVVPGFSALQELEFFVRAGLTPFEALRTGTVNAASALHAEAEFGTVDVGKRADLLLLEANPLSDISNIKQRAGVMLRGRWLPEAELRERLAEIERRAAQ
jgi:imidazolonepropionase-like amidohydrolase